MLTWVRNPGLNIKKWLGTPIICCFVGFRFLTSFGQANVIYHVIIFRCHPIGKKHATHWHIFNSVKPWLHDNSAEIERLRSAATNFYPNCLPWNEVLFFPRHCLFVWTSALVLGEAAYSQKMLALGKTVDDVFLVVWVLFVLIFEQYNPVWNRSTANMLKTAVFFSLGHQNPWFFRPTSQTRLHHFTLSTKQDKKKTSAPTTVNYWA